MIKIKPIDTKVFGIIEFLEIQIQGFKTSDDTCLVYVTFCDSNNYGIITTGTELSKEEFANWSDDNKYIEDLILKKLNLERA